MPDADLSAEELRVIQAVHDAWARSNGQWPTFAEVDKQLDSVGLDAQVLVSRLVPRYIRLESPGAVPAPADLLKLSVHALAALPTKPPIADTFLAAVRYMAARERAHTPMPPDDLMPSITSSELAQFLQASASIPRPPQIAHGMALGLAGFLLGEGHLWTGFNTAPDGEWTLQVSRRIRQFRDVADLEGYLSTRDALLGATGPGPPSATDLGSEDKLSEMVSDGSVGAVDPRAVAVVYGRDLDAKQAVFALLKDLDLHPLAFEELVAGTGSASPYVGDAVSVAFQLAQAVVVVLTPDDEARLLPALHGLKEPSYEVELSGQARPNVLFEAGMALASHPNRTVLIELGSIRPFSDIAGRHTVRLTGAAQTLLAVATRLQTAGCPVNLTGETWIQENEIRFKGLSAHDRGPVALPAASVAASPADALPLGTRIEASPARTAPARLSATVYPQGKNHLLEIANRGGVTLKDVILELPAACHNWHLITAVLPSWPINELAPREHVRFPVSISMGGKAIVEARLTATTDEGEPFEQTVKLSIYG